MHNYGGLTLGIILYVSHSLAASLHLDRQKKDRRERNASWSNSYNCRKASVTGDLFSICVVIWCSTFRWTCDVKSATIQRLRIDSFWRARMVTEQSYSSSVQFEYLLTAVSLVPYKSAHFLYNTASQNDWSHIARSVRYKTDWWTLPNIFTTRQLNLDCMARL